MIQEVLNLPVQKIAARIVAGMGQLSFRLTVEKKCGNGVASSLASAHQMRLSVRRVPIKQTKIEKKMMSSNPNVAPLLPVAWA